MNAFRTILIFCCLLSPSMADQATGERYITKSEFDAFVRQYRLERESVQPTPAPPAPVAASTPPAQPAGKCLAWKKGPFTFTPYGYINLSMSYETERSTTGDFCVFSNSPDLDGASVFSVDPRSTRLGMKVDGPGIPGWNDSKSQGVVEVDFQGSYVLRNRSALMLRKAYVAVEDKNTKFLAGQDWEVVSPLYPNTLNYTAGAGVGNLGYRRAMLRVDQRFDVSRHTDWTCQFALADNVIRDYVGVTGITPNVGGWPVLEGRIAYAFAKGRANDVKPVTLGVSGHIGEQQFDFGSRTNRQHFKTWSLNLDFDLPITQKLRFQAEYFLGENLGTIEGGIMQGIDFARRATIRSQGGWAGLQYFWTKKLQSNFCFLIDDPFNEDLVSGSSTSPTNALSRNYNHCLFVNALYNWSDALMTGFEVSFWRTHWQRYDSTTQTITPLRPGETIRYEFVTRYTF